MMLTRQPNRRKALLILSALLSGLSAASPAWAEDAYPSKPIRLVVPFAAGGAVDILARLLGEQMGQQMHQTFVVENRPGTNGNVAMDYVSRAPADGYTVILGSNGLGTNTALYPKMSFSIERDLAPVGYIGYAPLLTLVPAASPLHSLQDIVDAAKAAPGTLSFASAGAGSSGHLAAEMFRDAAKIDMVHVSYRGGAPAMVDLMAGRVSFMMLDPAQAMPNLKAGRFRALAVGGPHRLALLPNVPTMAEAGYGGVDAAVWWGFCVPAKTPPAIVARLNRELDAALESPAVKTQLTGLGVTSEPGTPEQFANIIRVQTQKWAQVVQRAHIQLD